MVYLLVFYFIVLNLRQTCETKSKQSDKKQQGEVDNLQIIYNGNIMVILEVSYIKIHIQLKIIEIAFH